MAPNDDTKIIELFPGSRPRTIEPDPPDALDRLAGLLALPRGLAVRADLKALTPEALADAGMSEKERARQLRLPLGRYPATERKAAAIRAWLRRRFGR